jgi:holliday junction DNA helicase RuvA
VIALLRGKLLEKHPNQVIIETGGVGYDVVIPVSTFSALPDSGAEVKLRIHTHVREDALSLFGFLTLDEKTIFEKLISVSGIGPTLAIKVLSGMATSDLTAAIRNGHVELLVRIPGVGKKTAERIVLELKDKLEGLAAMAAAGVPSMAAASALSVIEQDVMSALLNLGCNRAAAEAAVRKAKTAGAPAEFEPLFRRSLELVR